MPGNWHKLGIDRTETEFVKDFKTVDVYPLSAHNLRIALENYVVDNQSLLSHPLFLAMQFAIEYLKQCADQFDEHLAK